MSGPHWYEAHTWSGNRVHPKISEDRQFASGRRGVNANVMHAPLCLSLPPFNQNCISIIFKIFCFNISISYP